MALNKITPREFNRDGEGRASFPLMGHLREPKAERGLFDGEELIKRDEEINQIRASNNNIIYQHAGQIIEGLSPLQVRVILAISDYITTLRDSKGNIPQDIKQLIIWTEKKNKYGDEFTECAPFITRPVLLRDLAKKVFRRGGQEQRETIKREIYYLHNTEHVIETPHFTFKNHLIVINSTLTDKRDLEENTKADAMILTISPLLLWNITNKYISLSSKIFEILSKKGNNTLLLSRLLADILLVRGSHFKQANIIRYKGAKKGEKQEETENKIKEILLYKRPADTIAERTGNDYTSQKQYRSKFRTDLNKAIKALKEMEIITGGYLEPPKRGVKSLGEIILFLNENQKKESGLLKAPGEEEGEQ